MDTHTPMIVIGATRLVSCGIVLLLVMTTVSCRSSRRAAGEAELTRSIGAYLSASSLFTADRELATAIAAANADKAALASLLDAHKGCLLGGESTDEETSRLATARVLSYIAGRLGYTDLLAPYTDASSPSWLWVAFADSCGVVLYYAFVEGGRWDLRMTPESAKEIAMTSPYLVQARRHAADNEPGSCSHPP